MLVRNSILLIFRRTALAALVVAFEPGIGAADIDNTRNALIPGKESTPALGRTPDPAHLAELDITVYPDGKGLPSGSGNAAQGKPLYQQHCQACHGPTGANGINDKLTGGGGTLNTNAPQKTVGSYWPYATTLFDYIRRAMPYNATGTLNDDELYAITAYVLAMNNVIDNSTTLDANTLPGVTMPNRDGFHWPSHSTTQSNEEPHD